MYIYILTTQSIVYTLMILVNVSIRFTTQYPLITTYGFAIDWINPCETNSPMRSATFGILAIGAQVL
jgi:hypothetical protein